MKPLHSLGVVALATVLVGASCSSAARASSAGIVQPGAPGAATRALRGEDVSGVGQFPHTEADVGFMVGMIAHHAQALEMVDLVADRTENEQIQLLALRIDISQRDEIVLIQGWLEARGETVPSATAGHEHERADDASGLMPGMLTAVEMAELSDATGADFDQLLLEHMIRHHQGALVMVGDLFASEGGGQETEIWQFASHVDADQRVEIDRMSRMLRRR